MVRTSILSIIGLVMIAPLQRSQFLGKWDSPDFREPVPALYGSSLESTKMAEWIFDRAYFDGSTYDVAECSSNVWRLLSAMRMRGVDISHARVLYIFRLADGNTEVSHDNIDRLHPAHARFGIGRLSIPWIFHVSLEYRGEILDLDYRHLPHPVSKEAYFPSMFPEESKGASFFLRMIPALDYLREYDDHGNARNWTYYLGGGGGRYPLSTLTGFLRAV